MAATILHLTTGVVYVRGFSGTLSGGSVTLSGVLSLADSTKESPSLTNTGDTDTGLFFPFAGQIGFSGNGTHAATIQSSGLELGLNQYVAWADVAAGAAPDISLSRGAVGRLDLASGDSFALVNGVLTVHRPGIAVTPTDGLVLDNATAAAAGAQQMSPRIRWDGFGWKTDATAASQAVSFTQELLPVQGAAAPTANLLWKYAVNGGAYGTVLTLSSAGDLTAAGFLISSASIEAAAAGYFAPSGRTKFLAPADGVAQFTNNATTGFTRLTLGTNDASGVSLVPNGTTVRVMVGNGSALTQLDIAKLRINNVLTISDTAPTIASGFGTNPSIASSNGTAAFTVNVGTGGSAQTGVITLPASSNGWVVHAENLSTRSSTVFQTKQTASTTTSVTIGSFDAAGAASAWVASDILAITAMAI